MKEYTLTEEEIKNLKELLKDDFPTWPDAKAAIKDILPELFEKGFEVGKYYSYQNKDHEFVFKATKVTEIGGVKGYGLDLSTKYAKRFIFNDMPWTGQKGFKHAKEISQKEFMEYIKTYATEGLGFKEGVVFNNSSVYSNIISNSSKIEGDIEIGYSNKNDYLECEVENGYTDVIFKNGEFAEIIEQPKKDGVWQPTMYLRENKKGQLEQKWLEINTGEDEWREIEKA